MEELYDRVTQMVLTTRELFGTCQPAEDNFSVGSQPLYVQVGDNSAPIMALAHSASVRGAIWEPPCTGMSP